MPHPFLAGLHPTIHISHRGGAALAPENTLAAFRNAVSFRTDMLELDLQVTADGVLVVSHDDTLERCTDAEGPIDQRTFADLATVDAGYRFTPDGGQTFPFRGQGVRIPSLSQVLEEFPGLRLNLDVKANTEGIEHLLAEAVRRAGAMDRVCVGSEDDALSVRILAALPDAVHFYPRDAGIHAVLRLKSGAKLPADDPFRVMDLPLFHEGRRVVDFALCEAARAQGRWVNVWTVDDPNEMRRLKADGAGGIMTDRPDVLRKVLDAEV
jgi:glycerophosphoryl diester phosphodiesterase